MTWKECTNIKQEKKYQSWGLNWVIIGASILNKTEYLSRCANWFPEFENLKLSSASLKFKKILGATYALHGYSTWRHLFGRKANLPQARNATLTTFIFYSPFVTSVISGIFNMWLFFSGLVIKNCAKIKYFFIWISEYLHILLHREFCCDWRLSHPLWTYWCMYVLADWTVATFVLQVKIPHLQRTLLEFF